MIFIYNLAIQLYVFGIRLASLTGNQKARSWIEGRGNWRSRMKEVLKPGEKRIWFHCSSLGEFEQGRPVMENIKARHPELKIVLTFFSPSGYEVRKNYGGADYIFYMPADTRANADDFIELVNPVKTFFTKYEYWYHYFHQLKRRGVPLYMISAIFRPGDRFFKWYGGFFRKMLKCITRFFVQDERSSQLLKDAGFENVIVAGDTRFDRVVEVAKDSKDILLAKRFSEGQKVIVAGSTWADDERALAGALRSIGSGMKLIIAPHEVNASRISEINNTFSGFNVLPFSMAGESTLLSCDVLLIDNIGLLSSLFRYGTMAYIGGGFGKGIHNTLEAAVYGIPVIFGPNHSKFIEAKELIGLGAAFSVKSSEDLRSQLDNLFSSGDLYSKAGKAAAEYVRSRSGATFKIHESVFSRIG